MKMLIVGKNWAERLLLRRKLKNFTFLFTFEETDSAITAIKLLKHDHFDIMITFLDLPFMDGESLIAQVRRFNLRIKIIAVSFEKDFDQLKRLLPYTIAEYLVYPVADNTLENCLRRLFPIANETSLPYSKPVVEVIKIIMNRYYEPLTLEILADCVFLSPNYLGALFKKEVGQTISTFLIHYRMETAKKMLATTALKVNFIGKMVGIDNTSYFNRLFKETYQLSPTAFRKEQALNHQPLSYGQGTTRLEP